MPPKLTSSALLGSNSTTGRSLLGRPTTADILRAPAIIQRRADPIARIKLGCFVERSDVIQSESEKSKPRHKNRRLTVDKVPGSISSQDNEEQRSPRAVKAKIALLPKYSSICELIKTKLGAIQSNQQKLLQQSADMFGELSVYNELDLCVQDSLQDVVRLVSEDTVACRTVIDVVQNAIDVQGAWLTLMANSGYINVDLGHIQQLERIVNEQDTRYKVTCAIATRSTAEMEMDPDAHQVWSFRTSPGGSQETHTADFLPSSQEHSTTESTEACSILSELPRQCIGTKHTEAGDPLESPGPSFIRLVNNIWGKRIRSATHIGELIETMTAR